MELKNLIIDIGAAIKRIDSQCPQASNIRTEIAYQPGIGPHPETQAVDLIVNELQELAPECYAGRLHTDIPYRSVARQKCDLCIGDPPNWDWTIEVKMFRLMCDNRKPNDIDGPCLTPPAHRCLPPL